MKKSRKTKKKTKYSKGKRIFFKLIRGIVLISTITIFSGIGYFSYKYYPMVRDSYAEANNKISQIEANTFRNKDQTRVYDRNMNELAVYGAKYIYVPKDQIPISIQESFIAIEDERFYEHKGMDIKATLRAAKEVFSNDGAKVQGGSTITQQLIKNTLLSQDKTYSRKLEEIFISLEIEKKYNKDTILEYYLNNIYFGNGAYGIGSAALKYFNTTVDELSVSQSAFLTAIPNNPSFYDPIKNKENTLSRRDIVLYKMFELELITEQEYKDALEEEIVLDVSEEERSPETDITTFAIDSATKVMMELNGFELEYWIEDGEKYSEYRSQYSEAYSQARQDVLNGGFKIVSTIDIEKQQLLQDTIDNQLKGSTSLANNGVYEKQASATLIDNKTGEVVALVGGRTQSEIEREFNRAIMGYRQPASAIKPIITYAPAFEKGYLPSMKIEDKKTREAPSNAWAGNSGFVEIRTALEKSFNTIPYWINSSIGPDNLVPYLKEMEFSRLTPEDINSRLMATGGFKFGASSYEMTRAYSTLARNGLFMKSNGLLEVTDSFNNSIYKDQQLKTRVYDEGAAYLTTDVLKGVVEKQGSTGYGYGVNGHPTAAKTGTSDSSKDSWFSGYTNHYSMAVWVGYDSNKNLSRNETREARNIWKNYMDKIHSGLPAEEFDVPDRITEAYVNPRTFQISRTPVSGWRKELVPEIHFEFLEKKKLEEKRRQVEIALRRKEEQEQLERKRKRELEIAEKVRQLKIEGELERAGITMEQDLKAQDIAKGTLGLVSDFKVTSEETYKEAILILDSAKAQISRVVITENRKSLEQDFSQQSTRIEREITRIRDEKRRLEEERLRKEREEIERIERKAREEAERLQRIEEERLREIEENRVRQEQLERESLEEELSQEENSMEEEPPLSQD